MDGRVIYGLVPAYPRNFVDCRVSRPHAVMDIWKACPAHTVACQMSGGNSRLPDGVAVWDPFSSKESAEAVRLLKNGDLPIREWNKFGEQVDSGFEVTPIPLEFHFPLRGNV